MSRHHLAAILSHEEVTVEEVWEWRECQADLIDAEQVRIYNKMTRGDDLEGSRFAGFSRTEVGHFFDEQRGELNQAAMLGMLAAMEAAFRIDYIERVRNKKKDPISKKFSAIYAEQKLRVKLDEQILASWKDAASDAVRRSLDQFVPALKFRHWLAHGRYWRRKPGPDLDSARVFDLCQPLLAAIRSG